MHAWFLWGMIMRKCWIMIHMHDTMMIKICTWIWIAFIENLLVFIYHDELLYIFQVYVLVLKWNLVERATWWVSSGPMRIGDDLLMYEWWWDWGRGSWMLCSGYRQRVYWVRMRLGPVFLDALLRIPPAMLRHWADVPGCFAPYIASGSNVLRERYWGRCMWMLYSWYRQ